MSKLINLSLEELYDRRPRTSTVINAIVSKSNFSSINEKYCSEICSLSCKNYQTISLSTNEVDVLIIQDHKNPPGKFDRKKGQQDAAIEGIINTVCSDAGFRTSGIKYKLVSLLKCDASEKDFPQGKPPAQTTLQKCSPYLLQEIRVSKPKVIISLGTATTKTLGLTNLSNTGNRGEIAFSEYGPVVITLHPKVLSYIRQNARGGGGLWGPDYYKIIQRDFEKALKIATGSIEWNKNTLDETVKSLVTDRIRIARSIDDVQQFCSEINSLPKNAVISFDTETTSVDPLDPDLRILTIQFGWTQDNGISVARVIPLYHRENKQYDPDKAWEFIKPILEDPTRYKVGHNSKYDILVIYWAKGVRVLGVEFDTLLIQHSIESGTQGCYGLKTMCWDHLLDQGFAGYEEALGSLADLRKQKEKSLKTEVLEEELDE